MHQDNPLNDLPEGIRKLILGFLGSGKSWRADPTGSMIRDALERSVTVSQNWVDLFQDAIHTYEAADETKLLPEFASDRWNHLNSLRVGLSNAERALNAERLAFVLVQETHKKD